MLEVASMTSGASETSYSPNDRTYTSRPFAASTPCRKVRYGDAIVPSPSSLPSSPSTNTDSSASSKTRTTTSSVATPSAPLTPSCHVIVDTSSGATNPGVGPESVPAPRVTSGPDLCVHTTASGGVSGARPIAVSSTDAPTSTAKSAPASATPGTGVLVVVSGSVVVLVVELVEVVETADVVEA